MSSAYCFSLMPNQQPSSTCGIDESPWCEEGVLCYRFFDGRSAGETIGIDTDWVFESPRGRPTTGPLYTQTS